MTRRQYLCRARTPRRRLRKSRESWLQASCLEMENGSATPARGAGVEQKGGFPVRWSSEGGAGPASAMRQRGTTLRGRGGRAGHFDRHLRPALLEATLGRASPFANGGHALTPGKP
ncbi:hypothetical protein BN1263170145 [Stenotrophomonas indicatrix]|nr:hypothetical protein BN1263170145 [Stenotrophomonas indicatrix]